MIFKPSAEDVRVGDLMPYRPICRIYGSKAIGRTVKWLPLGVGLALYAAELQPSSMKAAYICASGWLGYTLSGIAEMTTYAWLDTRPVPPARPQGERLLHRWQVCAFAAAMGATALWQTLPIEPDSVKAVDKTIHDTVKAIAAYRPVL